MGKGGQACDLFFGSFYCACCILFIGPIFLFIGVAILGMSLDDGRGRKIHDYNIKVEEWRGKLASEEAPFPYSSIKGANFSAELSYAGCGTSVNHWSNLTLSGGEVPLDSLKDGSKDNAEPLAPQYKFFAEKNITVPRARDCKVKFTFKTGKGKVLAEVANNIGSETTSLCGSSHGLVECRRLCDSAGGSLRVPRKGLPECITRKELREVCIKVTYDKSKRDWKIDNANPETFFSENTYGCYYQPRSHGYLSESTRMVFSPAAFANVNEKQLDSTGARQVKLMVRDSADPWLHYLRITDGNGKFGLSTESKLIIGFSFLSIGILLTILEVKAFAFICYYKKNPAARRPRNTILANYYDIAHRGKHETTGIPVSMVAPHQHHQHHHYPATAPQYPAVMHHTVNPQHSQGNANAQQENGSNYAVVGTPLYINL